MQFQDMFGVSGIILGLLLVVAILARRDANRTANRYLAASLICSLSYLLALEFMLHRWLEGPALVFITAPYLLSAPLLFGYTRALTRPAQQPGIQDGIHLLPLLCVLLLTQFGFADTVRFDTESMAAARGGWPPSKLALMSIPFYGIQLLYLSLALSRTRSHRARIGDEFSYQEHITLRWLSALLVFHLMFSSVGLLIALLRMVPGVELWPRSLFSMSMTIAIYYLIAFMGVLQPAIFSEQGASGDTKVEPDEAPRQIAAPSDTPQPAAQTVNTPARYETSALTPSAAACIWSQLEKRMVDERLFLNPILRIGELAAQVDIPEQYLSQTINQYAGVNFFEFVNGFRLEAAKERLRCSDGSIASAALGSGFNSQSAFYRYFRKNTGMTPKQYRQRVVEPAVDTP